MAEAQDANFENEFKEVVEDAPQFVQSLLNFYFDNMKEIKAFS
tara:strand:+ start:360 stop:488 length:129 start_codon:yes stop_codon:yes gene_type:complete